MIPQMTVVADLTCSEDWLSLKPALGGWLGLFGRRLGSNRGHQILCKYRPGSLCKIHFASKTVAQTPNTTGAPHPNHSVSESKVMFCFDTLPDMHCTATLTVNSSDSHVLLTMKNSKL